MSITVLVHTDEHYSLEKEAETLEEALALLKEADRILEGQWIVINIAHSEDMPGLLAASEALR